MSDGRHAFKSTVSQIIDKYGTCLELVSMDPNFHNISVGLYVKAGICTVWTFSQKEGVEDRLRQIRDQLVALGDMVPIEGTHNQARFTCPEGHSRPVKFLMSQAVGKQPDYVPPSGELTIKDSKSDMLLRVDGNSRGDRWVYDVSGKGQAPKPELRLRMVVAGFVRYGEMEKVEDNSVAFQCGMRHDGLMRLLMTYSRNISSVEAMVEAEAMRGQMTTSTLGFSQT